jgi:hypothetical protein
MKRPLAPIAAYGPHTVKLLTRAFDDAWKAIAGNYGSPMEVEAAQQKLAKIILGLVPVDEVQDAERVKYSALVAMRHKESNSESLKLARSEVRRELRKFRWDDTRGLVRD